MMNDSLEVAMGRMITFCVTVTTREYTEQIYALADHACTAVRMAMALIFPDQECRQRVGGLKVVVEPVKKPI
jgi:hypothetical protein